MDFAVFVSYINQVNSVIIVKMIFYASKDTWPIVLRLAHKLNRQLFRYMCSNLLYWQHRSVGDQREVDARVRHQIGLKFCQVDVQGTVKSKENNIYIIWLETYLIKKTRISIKIQLFISLITILDNYVCYTKYLRDAVMDDTIWPIILFRFSYDGRSMPRFLLQMSYIASLSTMKAQSECSRVVWVVRIEL